MRIKGVGKCKPSAQSLAQEALPSSLSAASAPVNLRDELMGKGKESPVKEGLCSVGWRISAPGSLPPCVTSLLEVSYPRGPGWAPL